MPPHSSTVAGQNNHVWRHIFSEHQHDIWTQNIAQVEQEHTVYVPQLLWWVIVGLGGIELWQPQWSQCPHHHRKCLFNIRWSEIKIRVYSCHENDLAPIIFIPKPSSFSIIRILQHGTRKGQPRTALYFIIYNRSAEQNYKKQTDDFSTGENRRTLPPTTHQRRNW